MHRPRRGLSCCRRTPRAHGALVTSERAMAVALRRHRAGRQCPEECGGAYEFLASERINGYITGQIIEVNGGQLMP